MQTQIQPENENKVNINHMVMKTFLKGLSKVDTNVSLIIIFNNFKN